MKPRFREGEVVRVVEVSGGRYKSERWWMLGAEGVVSEYCEPDEDCSGWLLFVDLHDLPEEHGARRYHDNIVFGAALLEDDLESTGLQQNRKGERRPLDRTPLPEVMDKLGLSAMLLPESVRGRAATRELCQRLIPTLHALVDTSEIAYEVDYRPLGGKFYASFHMTLETGSNGFPAFKALAGLVDSGWYSSDDDGWSCGLSWNARYANPNTVFLAPGIDDVGFELRPWSTLGRRPEAERLPEIRHPRREEELRQINERSEELSRQYGPGLYLVDPADLVAGGGVALRRVRP